MIVVEVMELKAIDFREMALISINTKFDSFVAPVYEEIYIKSQEGLLNHTVDISKINDLVLDKFVKDLKEKDFSFFIDNKAKTIEIKW